ncbi:MAG: DUF5995 family protein [Actinomycetes bacterium]
MDDATAQEPPSQALAGVVEQMQRRLDALPPDRAHRRLFLSTYQRTTSAVGRAIEQAGFEDPDWVERWDVAFADLYLVAHDGDLAGEPARVARPWRLAFAAPPELPALRHVLLGINAHINCDLPQALLAVISDEEFADPVLLDRRRRDHERIDAVLSSRVAAEDEQLGPGAERTPFDRLLTPLNRTASKRFLKEARQKVWHNTAELQRARLAGHEGYRERLAELELLSAAKVADLLAPGQVVLRLAVGGFGVALPPPDEAPEGRRPERL